jgi:hypothetical protein
MLDQARRPDDYRVPDRGYHRDLRKGGECPRGRAGRGRLADTMPASCSRTRHPVPDEGRKPRSGDSENQVVAYEALR